MSTLMKMNSVKMTIIGVKWQMALRRMLHANKNDKEEDEMMMMMRNRIY
jgi:hypothetical protein